ncbi:DNA polymerase [Clostridium tyrobutyricum]|uniref:DNA polymerase n=1 Tax=Clostridium tyrobutyricum TaxID=1519 RepID=UPI001C38A013|nr:DNA polymerase [Clostridium tyrobutyricum]MBV4421054.1 DNA polymerase [Clostridium tyrobutyricum]
MKFISIDVETFSSVNLQKSGVYRYAESDDFEILLFGYSVDGGEVKVIDLAGGEKIPIEIINALTDDSVIKWAFNAQFERICLSKWLGMKAGTYLSPKSWHCTMIWAATLGLPLSLEGVGAVLGLEKQKLSEGKNLIKYFCIPCTPTKSNGGRTRNLPQHDIQKWETFISYNKRDVETEMAIQNKLSKFPVSKSEWKNYRLDQIINDCGINLDMDFVRQAISCDEKFKTENIEKAKKLTGLENPNSPAQLKDWLLEQGMKTDSLSKAVVSELLEDSDGEIHEVLSIRQKLAKSSVKKYTAMGNVVCRDSRARGLIQFYGANRTGRYSGRLIQVQNLPQNHLPDLKQARSLVKDGNFTALDLLYDSIPSVLSELIRTAFIPMYGSRFIVADFSAIEARVIAWLAGERWRMDVFAGGGDIYCASASQMFNVPVEKNGINGHLRQKGKIAELALGYGGSVGALKAMGAVQMGFAEDELKPIVNAWRNSNPNITSLWWKIDRAVKTVVKTKQPIEIYGIGIFYQSGILFIKLPSGRRLAYVKPLIGENRFGGESVTYEGVGGTKKWERIESYGSKFAENIVQAISRDILAEAMLKLAAHGFEIVMHVHDEVVIEVQNKISSVEEVCRIMSETPAWAKGLILNADGYECEFYKKE